MSRDWEPIVNYCVDKNVTHLSRQRIALQNERTGEVTVLYDPQSDFSKKYPKLSFLIEERNFQRKVLSNAGISSEYIEQALAEAETNIRRLLNFVDSRENEFYQAPLSFNMKAAQDLIQEHLGNIFGHSNLSKLEKDTVDWFLGKLDPYFYCSDDNKMFYIQSILRRAEEIQNLGKEL